jgi:hypothetical protein
VADNDPDTVGPGLRSVIDQIMGLQVYKAAADFENAMAKLQALTGADRNELEELRASVMRMARVGGMSLARVGGMSPAHAADQLAAVLAEDDHRDNDWWATLYPEVAALGNDAPHISICDGPSPGDLTWSWWSKGQRHWRCAP